MKEIKKTDVIHAVIKTTWRETKANKIIIGWVSAIKEISSLKC